MEIEVSVGEWMTSLEDRMSTAVEGDYFHLPTRMHLHAFKLLQQTKFPDKKFKIVIGSELIE
tara:strand:- start:1841 stop:2026 length:186 start_codon:yes stop_codon:yes gene_type:complete